MRQGRTACRNCHKFKGGLITNVARQTDVDAVKLISVSQIGDGPFDITDFDITESDSTNLI